MTQPALKEASVDDAIDEASALPFLGQLMDTLHLYADVIQVICNKLPETAGLVQGSAEQLSARFMQLAEVSGKQSEQVQGIVNMASSLDLNGEKISLQEFTDLFARTLSGSIEKILFISQKAISMVYKLDEAMTSLSAIEGFVGDIQRINKQANLLALNATIEAVKAGEAGKSFGVVADEVKQVSQQIQSLATNMNKQIKCVTDSVNEGFAVLKEVATTDMSENIMAREKLDQLMHSLMQQSERFKLLLQDSANTSRETSRTISGMVMDLQFQDRNTQYINESVGALSHLKHYLEHLAVETIVHHDRSLLLTLENISNQFKMTEFRQNFLQEIAKHPSVRAFAMSQGHEPVALPKLVQSQAPTASGSEDIELF